MRDRIERLPGPDRPRRQLPQTFVEDVVLAARIVMVLAVVIVIAAALGVAVTVFKLAASLGG